MKTEHKRRLIGELLISMVEYYNREPLSVDLTRMYINKLALYDYEQVQTGVIACMNDGEVRKFPLLPQLINFIPKRQADQKLITYTEEEFPLIDRKFQAAMVQFSEWQIAYNYDKKMTSVLNKQGMGDVFPLPDPKKDLDGYLGKVKKYLMKFKSFNETFIDQKMQILRSQL